MIFPFPYISRQAAEELEAEFAKALDKPENSPLAFLLWGIGGEGKTTLTRKIDVLLGCST